MNDFTTRLTLAAMTLAATALFALPAAAQVAGSTSTVDISVIESTQAAMGWSVRKTLLGKSLFNETGQKVGKVEDLIISPDRSVSYVIVAAGGFLGVGRHDVAIPVARIEEKDGRLVMAGATKNEVKAMPPFIYATNTARRDQFISAANKDIAAGKARVADLELRAGSAAADARVKIQTHIDELRSDVRAADEKLGEMKQASAEHWKQFEASVNAATARLRKSVATAMG